MSPQLVLSSKPGENKNCTGWDILSGRRKKKNPTSFHVAVWSRDCLQMLGLLSRSTSEQVLATAMQAGGQGEGRTRLRSPRSRMTGCRLDTRLADGISKSFHEPSGMCTMITNHTYNKARRAASQGGWGERAGGEKRGKRRKPRGTNSVTFPRHSTGNNQHLPARALSQPGTTAPRLCVHRPAASQPAGHRWSSLPINSHCN